MFNIKKKKNFNILETHSYETIFLKYFSNYFFEW